MKGDKGLLVAYLLATLLASTTCSRRRSYTSRRRRWSHRQQENDQQAQMQRLLLAATTTERPSAASNHSSPQANGMSLELNGPCAPVPFDTLLQQFRQVGELNPNYVATTKEEAALFPDMNWPAEKVTRYGKMLRRVKRRLLRFARNNLDILFKFKRLLTGKLHLGSHSGRRRSLATRRRMHHKSAPRRKAVRTRRANTQSALSDLPSSSITTTRQCLPAGSYASSKTLRSCESCGATTVLPVSSFPRYINEITCGTTASKMSCFQGNGRCVQKYFTMRLLRKTGACVPIVQRGVTVLVDQWQPYYQEIRTCCECEISDNSFLRWFV